MLGARRESLTCLSSVGESGHERRGQGIYILESVLMIPEWLRLFYPPPQANPCKIFVGGLTPGTTEEILRAHFGQYGEIVDAVVMKDDHRSRGFGFVTFSDSKAVEDSLDAAPHV